MIQTRIINEINKSYLEITGIESVISDDYRLKMLEENSCSCFLQKSVKSMDGQSRDLYEITGKESIASFFNLRVADRNELEKLFKSMKEAVDEAEKLLIEEGNIMFRPDCIFIDCKTMEYEFICIPVENTEENRSANLAGLMQFFLSKLDDNDIELLKTVYSMFDKAQSAGITASSLFELLVDGISRKKEPEVSVPKLKTSGEKSSDNNVKKKKSGYVPSFRGVAAVTCALGGIVLIGYNAYLMMI